MAIIKAGWGVNINQDFTRLAEDTPIEIRERRGSMVYGTIKGNPDNRLGFMRHDIVHVRVDARAIAE